MINEPQYRTIEILKNETDLTLPLAQFFDDIASFISKVDFEQ